MNTMIPRVGEYDVVCHYCTSSVPNLNSSISQSSSRSSGNNQPPQMSDWRSFVTYPGVFVGPPRPHLQPSPVPLAHHPYVASYSQYGNREPPKLPQISLAFVDLEPRLNSASPASLSPNPLLGPRVPVSTASHATSSLNPEAQDFKPGPPCSHNKSKLSDDSSPRDDEFRATILSPNSGWSSCEDEPDTSRPPTNGLSPITPISHPSPPSNGITSKVADLSLSKPMLKSSATQHAQMGRDSVRRPNHAMPYCEAGKTAKAENKQKRSSVAAVSGHGHDTAPDIRPRPRRIRLGYHVRKHGLQVRDVKLGKEPRFLNNGAAAAAPLVVKA
jgi:hypothetical protein